MTRTDVGNLLGAAAVALCDRIGSATSDVVGIGGEAPAALLAVGARPGRSIEHLRRTLGLSHSGTVRLVDRLEGAGWVERVRSEGGREVRLELTVPGEELHERVLGARRRVLEEVLGPVPPAGRAQLGRALAALLAGLPGDRDEAWRICRLCEHGVCRGAACPVGHAVEEEPS